MSKTPVSVDLRSPSRKDDAVTDVEGTVVSSDTRGPIRLGFWILVVGFGGFLAWAAYAPLDEGVSAPATVSIETKRRAIQHMTGGIVKALRVKEGQAVHTGDVLVELDDAPARANFETVRQNYMSLRAAESRLLAEEAEKQSIVFHPDLVASASDPFVKQHMVTQTQLFTARRAALAAELGAARESIAGFEAQITGIGAMLESRRAQAALLAEQTKGIRDLAAQGYAPRNQLLQLEQQQAELRATIADLEANRVRATQSIAEIKMRMTLRRQEYHKEAGAQLAEVRREVQAGAEKLKAVSDELGRVQITSPVDGQVVGIAVSALGAVVTPGQKIMDIVPKGETLLLDARVPPQVIDRVAVGDETDVRFSGFANSPQLVVKARLVSLSGDALTEQISGNTISYYLGRVEVTPEGFKELGNRVLQPGMPAEVLIKTGERSLLTYLLHPLTKRIAASMKEE